MEEELHERPLYRRFAGLDGAARMPDETNILCFRHLLEKHQLAPQVLAAINTGRAQQGLMLKTGTIVDATIIAAPSSTKNKEGERDPEMHQPKKGNQWHFGMKAHIGVDADSGLVHTVIGTAANVNDATQAAGLLHGKDKHARGDAGYQGVDKRQEMQGSKAKAKIKWQVASGKWQVASGKWQVAMRPGKRKALDPNRELHKLLEKAAPEGQRACQGGAPVPGDQAAVWLCQGALPRVGEEHGAADDAVCAGQSVDDQEAHHGAAGIGASVGRQSGATRAETGLQTVSNRPAKSGLRRHQVTLRSTSGCAGLTNGVFQTFLRCCRVSPWHPIVLSPVCGRCRKQV